jgi:cyclophilin family peptidyl-prolyl cis-trans isomerase/HEAT repeat protein
MSRQRRIYHVLALAALAPLAACRSASSKPAAVAPAPPPPAWTLWSIDRKVGAVLRLEDERRLDDAAGASLLDLVTDADVHVRRRAALAIGRASSQAGNDGGIAALVSALGDADETVRASAAFALGLAHAAPAVDALTAALSDAQPIVKARAADALALILEPAGASGEGSAGKPTAASAAAAAIAASANNCAALMAPIAADDQTQPLAPEIDACRAAILATARLRTFDALARIVLSVEGKPVSSWWPVAYALQRVRDKRGADALAQLANADGVSTPAFAMRGLADYGDRRAVGAARALAVNKGAAERLRVAAIDMLARLKDADSVPMLKQLVVDRATPPNILLTAVAALGSIGDQSAFDVLADRFNHSWAPMRAATMAAAARLDPEGFLLLVSGIGLDKDWSVRASLATTLSSLDPDRVLSLVSDLANDADARVQAPALEALAKLKPVDLDTRLAAALGAADFNVRATAASLIGGRTSPGGAALLAAAYTRGQSDANESARGAALEGLAEFGREAASATLHEALNDRDWSIRLKAADLLRKLGETDAQPARPAPARLPAGYFESPALLHPQYSPHAFVETRYGTIEIELNVVEAPVATGSFVALARRGYFNGMRIHRVVPNFVVQAGDDRGDGAGGPGYTLRDELSPLPYLRGTVGMALGGPDTGGSQFFITVSPQPHLEGKYAVFGKVVRGMEFVDQLTLFDVIERVRIWDGVSFER